METTKVVKEVLDKLHQEGEAVVVGGYIRDTLLQEEFNDVDIVTTCSFDYLKKTFPNLDWTERGLEFGICRTKYKGIPFEFSFVKNLEDYKKKILDRDFTINSFHFDGNKLFSLPHADEDLENKILRPVEPFYEHLLHSPNTLLRAFRICGLYNFSFHPELLDYIQKHKGMMSDISKNQMTEELYKTINSPYVLKAVHYMCETGLLPQNEKLKKLQHERIELINSSIPLRMSYLNYMVGGKTIIDMISTFHLSTNFIETIEKYRYVYETTDFTNNKSNFPHVLILKRYQFKDDKKKLSDFLKGNK